MNEARWLTVEQIRKQQRMRRERVLEAMLSGEGCRPSGPASYGGEFDMPSL